MFDRHEFSGLTPRVAKRRALNYWYAHRGELNMSMAQFFAHCRLTEDPRGVRIVFYGDRVAA